MQQEYMRKSVLILFCLTALASVSAFAESYTLTDGTKIDGDPISETDNGVVFRGANGNDTDRVSWDKLTQDSIRTLYAGAKNQREKSMIEPLIEEQPKEKAERKEIVVKPIEPPVRPTKGLGFGAIFTSPVGLLIMLVLYGANIFAASEVALYRRQPKATVCGLAAIPFLGVFSPIAYLAMPTRPIIVDGQVIQTEMEPARFRATPPPAETTAPPPEDVPGMAPVAAVAEMEAAAPVAPVAAPSLPPPVIFKRGDFSFNRRFFETKLAGFFRVVPSEAERDMVIHIKSGRGNFSGRRITRISPTELNLQVFHDNATADEMIPFGEILEVQIRHKDLA